MYWLGAWSKKGWVLIIGLVSLLWLQRLGISSLQGLNDFNDKSSIYPTRLTLILHFYTCTNRFHDSLSLTFCQVSLFISFILHIHILWMALFPWAPIFVDWTNIMHLWGSKFRAILFFFITHTANHYHQGQGPCDLDFDLCSKNSFFRLCCLWGIVFHKHTYLLNFFLTFHLHQLTPEVRLYGVKMLELEISFAWYGFYCHQWYWCVITKVDYHSLIYSFVCVLLLL